MDVDVRRLGRVVGVGALVALAVVAVVLIVAGVHKNAQITDLRRHGVAVRVTVSSCLGLLGGSGSNGAGYACKGTFMFDGNRYTEAIPGTSLYPPGARIAAVAAPGSPPLLSLPRTVEHEHASWRVFILPAVLLVVLVLVVGVLVLRHRRRRPNGDGAPASSLAGKRAR